MAKITYVVSGEPDRIEQVGEDALSQYGTPEEAGQSVKNDWHGAYGTKYVLAIQVVEMIAEYSRPWTMVRKG